MVRTVELEILLNKQILWIAHGSGKSRIVFFNNIVHTVVLHCVETDNNLRLFPSIAALRIPTAHNFTRD